MNCEKMGQLIRTLRLEKALTQQQLANRLLLSDKTISKWERGLGCPDVSLLAQLADCLDVNLKDLLQGELSANDQVGGNMKQAQYFVCPTCGNLTVCTGHGAVSCCGRALEALTPQKAQEDQKLTVEQVEDDWYLTSDHPMTKDDYIAFVAFATGERLQVIPQYPEWNLCVRIQRRGHGKLLFYSRAQGLLYQLL